MKIVLLNIRSFFKNQKLIFVIFLLCVMVSSFVLNFSYGIYKNFVAQKNNAIQENKEIVIELANQSELKKKDFENFFVNLNNEIISKTQLCYIKLNSKQFDKKVVSRFSMKDGKYEFPSELRDYYNRNNILLGKYFSNEDENSKEKIIISYNEYDFDKQVKLWGQSYDVVAVDKVSQSYEIPFNSVPDDVNLIDYIIWMFDDSIDKTTYDLIKIKADEYIPGCLVFPDLNLPDYDSIKIYNNITAIAIVLSFLSAANIAMLFSFIIQKRKKNFSIFKITGCTGKKIIFYYLSECFTLILPSYLIGTIVFDIMLKLFLTKKYKYMLGIYSFKVYLFIFLMYVTISIMILSIVLVKYARKSINEEWRD